MCEKGEDSYVDGEVVWVKLGSCWWPGEVVDFDKLPPDVLPSLRKPPIAAVKFFQEDAYEFVKNENLIDKYNCSRKNEFISKGLNLYRTKHGLMEKFPEDVVRAETAVGGDIAILTRDEFQEKKKESYAGIFGDSAKKTPGSNKKGKRAKGRPGELARTPMGKTLEKNDYKVHILVQGSKTPSTENISEPTEAITAINSANQEPDSPDKDQTAEETEKPNVAEKPVQLPTIASTSGIYSCHACPFTTSRLNVLILHNKTHSVSFMPYTPSPIKKKVTTNLSSQSSSGVTKTPKSPKPRKEKSKKESKKAPPPLKKRAAEEPGNTVSKKVKTDEEIKSSLLADWDDGDEESNDESLPMIMAGSPEVPQSAESPAVPTSAELSSTQERSELSSPTEKKSSNSPSSEKAEASSDSKYEFCEDEDWHVEADAGRKIPRVKNPKRKEDTKSLSVDDDEMAREVAELLNKTTVPDLPIVPEALKVEENFPEPSVVKSPDKEKSPEKIIDKPVEVPTKAIFKTKTFFRSRHSRSQDAIGKYVAEQLNAVERMDISESDINGSEAVSSPETRESPPIEPVKVARLAPKIQLKKMKLEAAQRDKEKNNLEYLSDFDLNSYGGLVPSNVSVTATEKVTESTTVKNEPKIMQDVLYPTQEIKPVNTDKMDQNILTADRVKSCENSLEVFNESTNIKDTVTQESEKENVSHVSERVEDTDLGKSDAIKQLEKTEFTEETCEISKAMDCEDVTQESVMQNITNESQLHINHQHDDNVVQGPIDKGIQESLEIAKKSVDKVISETENLITVTELPIVTKESENTIQGSEKEATDIDQYPVSKLNKTLEKSIEPFMSESTASAVDALLSVSRETDRVTRVISDDPPEDLFEDDTKDNNETYKDVKMFNEGITTDNSGKYSALANQNNDINSFSNDFIPCEKSLGNVKKIDGNHPTTDIVPSNVEIVPSESDLQIAEALMNLPSTAIPNKTTSEHRIDKKALPIESGIDEIIQGAEKTISSDETDNASQQQKTNIAHPKSLLISNNEDTGVRYETEQEKSENLNAAQSLVQMSESIDRKINLDHKLSNSSLNNDKDLTISDSSAFDIKASNGLSSTGNSETKIASDNSTDSPSGKNLKMDMSSSKLLKILEEPCTPKLSTNKSTIIKQTVLPTGKEKVLNFDVAKSSFKGKSDSPKQKIIIRRTTPGKNIINNITDITKPEKIILSRSKNPSLDESVQTYTIQTTPDTPSESNALIIQQKVRKIAKPSMKLQKIKPQNSVVVPIPETKVTNEVTINESIFDINSMPIVLSEDLLTAENIEKMPIVMSDGNILAQASNPPKLVKTKQHIENEKVPISATPSKPEVKTLLINPVNEVVKVTTPNILSKSSKLRAAKPMLVIDKTTGKQKIIMTKGEPTIKEVKQLPTIIQNAATQNAGKTEKFIILPTQTSPRPATRTQKIVIDPQTGKAHVLVAKGSETQQTLGDNKTVSAKLIPSSTDASTTGNTVMIITNAQGAQSRIVLTPEHEKMLFPKKQQPNITQLKTITHRITTNNTAATKSIVTSIAPAKTQNVAPVKTQTLAPIKAQNVAQVKTPSLTPMKTQNVAPVKTQTRIVPKQKSAIITSKGQLIVGGRVATTAQNIAPMPEIRPVPKRIIATEPKKLVQAIQKASSEPLIFLQQKSGAVMQLTTAQFEHLQRTGQIVQKASAAAIQEKAPTIQKTITVTNEPTLTAIPKARARKNVSESPAPLKKLKHEKAIAPAPAPPVPSLAPFSNTIVTSIVPSIANTISISTSSTYSDLDNFEELLPSTAIVRQAEPVVTPTPAVNTVIEPQPQAASLQAPISDGQLIAVPGEHFGGPAGSFYLCVEDNGSFTPIDHRPLVLDNNQLVPMAEPLPVLGAQPERRDILEAALANSDVFHADTSREEAPAFRNLNPNASVSCQLSETITTLNQAPIMTPVEVPTKVDGEPTVLSNIEDGLAVIGVAPHIVPTSLELPITVTDPRIAPKTTDPLSSTSAYGTAGLLPSPNTEMAFITSEAVSMVGPISMPLLTDDESVGKSMPILTDDMTERTVSSVDSTIGSPSPVDVRESENEDSVHWTRRLLTPSSDTSEASAEIPLQPAIQLSVNELSRQC